MQLSQETYRTRWLVLVACWTIAAMAFFVQARLVRDYLNLASLVGLRGAPAATTPFQMVYPAFGADAQVWVRHAVALVEGDDVRLRQTTIDNAPTGREVHWNSAWAWTIAGAGRIRQLFTLEPLTLAMERATLWVTPTALLILTIILSAWTTRRAGLVAGVLIAAAMIGKDRIFEGFFPSYVDHHGLLTVSVLGLLTGAAFMGGGWWRKDEASNSILPSSPEIARSSAVMSALCGACGLWVTAASAIPPIAIVGFAGVVTIVACARSARHHGAEFDPMTWRIWGRVGGIASLAFYLLEYFPNHLALRLEPNHPFHALAWWGGGELIAEFGTRWLAPSGEKFRQPLRLVLPALAVCVTPLAILIGGPGVFVVIDPFLSKLHNDYIQEFLPLWRTLRGMTAAGTFQLIGVECAPLVAAIATLSYRRGENLLLLWFVTIACVCFNLLAWWQSRWLLNASGAHVALVLVVFATWFQPLKQRGRWIAAGVVIGLLFLPSAINRYRGAAGDLAARRVSPTDAKGALMRDIAAALRASQPQGDIVLLSSPNGSTGIGYYGRFKTIGTLYWENNAGLKAAGRIFSAPNEAEAAKLIREHGITHLAILTEENFIVQYNQLLKPGAKEDEIRRSFGVQIAHDTAIPSWLQMLPYRVPPDLRALNIGVMLFKVRFDQSVADALYSVVLNQIENEQFDAAEKTIDLLIAQAGNNFQPWMRKAEILIRRRDWLKAAEHVLVALARASDQDRPSVAITFAPLFYNNGQHALAARIYQVSLEKTFEPSSAAYLAWILATSTDASVRNGADALRYADAALKADPNSATFLNSMAAALAENQRFDEAIAISDRAIANALLKGDQAAAQQTRERQTQFREKKPLRY